MSTDHVGHRDIVAFADERVNLKRDDAYDLRRQANMLRDRLENYIGDNPHFELRKMLLSGSLAKGTALKSISDIDVGCYVSSSGAPHKISDLIEFIAVRLAKAFPNFRPDQIKPKEYSVAVNFITTGNEVDIVPILYSGDPQWRGDLVSQDTGEKLMTSIPMHLDFIRRRKTRSETHFAQVVRLIKFWCKLQKQADPENFRFKSFMVELLVAHLADRGLVLNDYPEALAKIFTYMASDDFRTVISFADYYDPSMCKATTDPVRIWDPVNCENNVAKLYEHQQIEDFRGRDRSG
ncbi:CBASS oligonucleotide cyclase [Mesorhizobium sp. L103C131B0]|uniref:CBASS oligonucleotide cyclase n=1 Tax=Mesorhizobium sp. L103C131B0 TaxID=1287089 RepID=UPI000429D6A3|nr:CBASS oligonucleotide cyclase [Mesorhizobium sp. L103C131B0]